MKKFKTKYGYFTADGNEYVITDYKTPMPWVNVLSNGSYGLVISQSGGGFSWREHSEFNRLNRWHQDMLTDNWGKFFYIKNNITGEFWSPTWVPVKQNLDFYEIRYGLGYAVFHSSFKKIDITLTVHIPMNQEIEIWDFQITNKSSQKIDLSIYSFFEWCLGSSSDHHREFHKTFIETDFHSDINAMLATKRLWEIPLGDRGHWNIEYPYFGFIAATKKITDYDGDKATFIGRYNGVDSPEGLKKDELSKRLGKWNDSIGTVKVVQSVESGQTEKLSFLIGIKSTKQEIGELVEKYMNTDAISQSLAEVKLHWNNFLSPLSVETPDEAINILVNKWLRYQTVTGRLLGRTAYYQQSGAFGFRDQLQDSLVYLPTKPELTEKQIKLHARHQFEDGAVLHWWHPISETGLPTKMTDDLLWLPFIIIHYLEETGNYKFLDEIEPYYDNPGKMDTLFDHCVAAIKKVLSRFSERGLPLIGAGDWNDGLSAVGLEMKGESIWLAEFFYGILVKFSHICKTIGKDGLSLEFYNKAEKLKVDFNQYAWDGEWFFRATKDDGNKIGSKENLEGKIFLNAQTWSVISGITDNSRMTMAMNSVTEHLLKNNGALLLQPAYSTPDKYIGYLSRYAPGRRENGGVYTHAATWAIWAYALLKDKKNTWEAYKRLNPITNGQDPDKYVAEPYVTPGNIDGPDSPNYGMGGWTWYTGSASWYQKVIVDWILGVRATEQGLIIDPCVPDEWGNYTVNRRFRGTNYKINIINKFKSNSVKELLVNGTKINGNIIDINSESTVEVKVTI